MIILFASPVLAQNKNGWRYQYQKGILQYKNEMYDYALENFNRALQNKPDLYEAANYIAEIHMIKNNRHDALDFYLRSLLINDNQAEIHCRAGELFDYLAEKENAFRHYQRAITIDPNHLRAHLHMVRHYLAAGNREEARKQYNESRQLCLEKAAPLLKKARAADDSGNTEEALRLYKLILTEYPALSEVYLRLYDLYREKKHYPEAVQVLKDLLYTQPEHDGAHARLGTLYLACPMPGNRKLQLDLAERHLIKAIELNPKNIPAMESLVDLYRLRRETDRAISMEEKVRQMDGSGKP